MKNKVEVFKYVDDVITGKKVAGKEIKQACERFRRDLENPKYDFKPKDAEFVIGIIEKTFVHRSGSRYTRTDVDKGLFAWGLTGKKKMNCAA